MTDIETPTPRRRRLPLIVLAAVLAALVVVGSVLWATRTSTHKKQAAAPLPTPTQSSTPSVSTTPKAKPARSKGPHEYVAAAAPTAFSFTGKAFRIKANVCGMEYVRPLDPPGNQHSTVCWVKHDFGFAPASKARGTTYVLGHAWGQDRLEVLNKISEAAMRQVLPAIAHGKAKHVSGIPTYPVTTLNGYVISLRTAQGVLRYTVKDAYAVSKAQAGNVQPLMAEHTRNRVVIITCGELNHVDYEYNIIVEAYLTSSVATRSKT